MNRVIHPEHFARARGYANGMTTALEGGGELLFVGGQIGWQADQSWAATNLAEQFAQTLDNVIDVVRAAGGAPTDVIDMTIYVTDMPAYRAAIPQLGAMWRERFGKHYPAMALIGVSELVEPNAMIEIQAVATIRPA